MFNFNPTNLKNNSNAFLQLCTANINTVPLYQDNILANGIKYLSAKTILINAFQHLFTNMDAWNYAFNISDFIEPYLTIKNDQFCIENIQGFMDAFLVFALNYYAYVEKFDYFAVASKDKFVILSKEACKDANTVTKYIRILTMPNFSEKSTDQDRKPSIGLKG